jgi:outer membrane lipoprotein-sorting protein
VSFLRRVSTTRLVTVCTAAVVLGAGGVALGQAVAGGGPVPPRRSLPVAIHQALGAPAVSGVSGRISFTNRLIGMSGVEGATPLLTGASGRVWAAPDRRLRLELQSDRGDVLLVSDGQTLTLYDGSARTAYRGQLPPARDRHRAEGRNPPSLATIRQAIARFERRGTVSGPRSSSLAGEPAYTVRVSPRPRAGLLGAVELAWDASHGVPLRVAAFARGQSRPVLELQATDVSFGSVPSSVFSFTPPPGTKVVNVDSTHSASTRRHPSEVSGVPTVRRAVPFGLRAPARLAGMPLTGAHGLGRGGRSAALLVYGHGLGGLAVVEKPAAGARSDTAGRGRLPQTQVQVGSVAGQAIATPLGTLVRFSRGGVEYTVVGLVTKSVALSAARGL